MASLVLLLLGFIIRGVYIGADTDDFLGAGQEFIDLLSHWPASWETLNEHRLFPNYFVSSMVLSGIYYGLSLQAIGVVVFNSVLFSLTVCLIVSTWYRLVINEGETDRMYGLLVAAGGLYVVFGLPDAFLWSYAVLTDTMFLFWVALFVAMVVRAMFTNSISAWSLALVVSVVAPFIRPPGILLPVLFIVGFVLNAVRTNDRPFAFLLGAIVVLPGLFVFGVVPWLVTQAANGGSEAYAFLPGVLEKLFRQSVIFFENGVTVSTRHEVEISGPLTIPDVWRAMVTRLGYYWVPLRFGERPYSDIHNVVNLVYMVATLPLFVLGAVRLIRLGYKQRKALLFLIVVAYGYALLHSVTLVSFDWRYQLPAMVPYWILAGCGLLGVLRYLPVYRAGRTHDVSQDDVKS